MKWAALSIPSTFPPTRRPIYVYPTAPMSRKNQQYAYPLVAEAIGKILSKEPGKGLIHSVSYDLTKFISEYLVKLQTGRDIFHYSNTEQRGRAIERFMDSQSGVLIAPSLDRGIDLPQDRCRFIVVSKLPFPSLGTKQVSARLHSKGGQLWYNVKTVRSLVQMTGRGMRSSDDYCTSYILDKQFVTLIWKRSKQLLPEWWREALVWNGLPL